jgi:hypothetical protein
VCFRSACVALWPGMTDGGRVGQDGTSHGGYDGECGPVFTAAREKMQTKPSLAGSAAQASRGRSKAASRWIFAEGSTAWPRCAGSSCGPIHLAVQFSYPEAGAGIPSSFWCTMARDFGCATGACCTGSLAGGPSDRDGEGASLRPYDP